MNNSQEKAQSHNILIRPNFKTKYFSQNIQILDKFKWNVKGKIYSLHIHLHKYQLYYLERHSQAFEIWSAIIRINTD